MRTIWHSLTWKEWHEHKWTLVAIMAVLCGLVLLARSQGGNLFSNISLAVLMCIIPMAVFVGMGTAASESSRGTLPFLQALPISHRRVAIAKLLAGVMTCLVPPLLVILLLFAGQSTWGWWGVDYYGSMNFWQGPLDVDNWFIEFALVVTLWVVSLFLWTAAVGVNRADEVSAGAMALSVIVGIWVVLTAVYLSQDQLTELWLSNEKMTHRLGTEDWFTALVRATAPGGLAGSRDLLALGGPAALSVVGLFIAVHAALAARYVSRFGRVADRRIRSPQSAASGRGQLDWLAPPRRSRVSAITWKQLRESGPIVLAGLSGAAAIVVVAIGVYFAGLANIEEEDIVIAFAGTTFVSCLYLGGFTTLVVGIGVFLRDLDPGLNTFWRSRPISPHTWYWIKFGIGLAVVLLTFQLPMLLVSAAAWHSPPPGDFSEPFQVLRVQLIALAVFVAVYGIAIATTCLVRSAVLSAVLSIAAVYLGPVCVAFTIFAAVRVIGYDMSIKTFMEESDGGRIWIAGIVIAAVIGTLVGWLAVWFDWGRKSRY